MFQIVSPYSVKRTIISLSDRTVKRLSNGEDYFHFQRFQNFVQIRIYYLYEDAAVKVLKNKNYCSAHANFMCFC